MEGKKLIAVLTIFLSALLLSVSVFFWTSSWQWISRERSFFLKREVVQASDDPLNVSSLAKSLPEVVGEKYLARKVSGSEAIELMTGLLGPAFSISESNVYSYRGSGSEVTYWITRLESPGEAQRLFLSILTRVKEQDSFHVGEPERVDYYFLDTSDLLKGVLEVYPIRVAENGFHYLYKSDFTVYWVSVTCSQPDQTFRDTFQYFF